MSTVIAVGVAQPARASARAPMPPSARVAYTSYRPTVMRGFTALEVQGRAPPARPSIIAAVGSPLRVIIARARSGLPAAPWAAIVDRCACASSSSSRALPSKEPDDETLVVPLHPLVRRDLDRRVQQRLLRTRDGDGRWD